MIGQTKKGSFTESLANVLVGYGLALVSQIVIFHYYGIRFALRTNMEMGVWFTAISIARSYTLRRAFNWITARRKRSELLQAGLHGTPMKENGMEKVSLAL